MRKPKTTHLSARLNAHATAVLANAQQATGWSQGKIVSHALTTLATLMDGDQAATPEDAAAATFALVKELRQAAALKAFDDQTAEKRKRLAKKINAQADRPHQPIKL